MGCCRQSLFSTCFGESHLGGISKKINYTDAPLQMGYVLNIACIVRHTAVQPLLCFKWPCSMKHSFLWYICDASDLPWILKVYWSLYTFLCAFKAARFGSVLQDYFSFMTKFPSHVLMRYHNSEHKYHNMLDQRCQTRFHRGPHERYVGSQRANCN